MHRLIQRTLPSRQYIGQVGTRCYVPNTQFQGSGSNFSVRMYHYMREDVPWVRVVPGGGWWSIGASGAGEGSITAGPFSTVTASIEYPEGVYHQVTWGGSPTLVLGANPTVAGQMSDPVHVAIPRGAKFWTRRYIDIPLGAQGLGFIAASSTPGTWMDVANGDAGCLDSADRTMGGTIANDGNVSPGQICMLAIIGPTRRPSVGLFGDSRMQGWYDDASASPGGDTGEVARSVGPHYGYINAGIGSDEIQGVVASGGAKSALRRELLSYCSHIVLEYGGNDLLFAGAHSAAVIANLTAAVGLPGIAGKSVIVDTILPESSSTDGWETTANQTTGSINADRNAINAAIRSGLPGAIGYFDPCAYGEYDFLAGTGLWTPGGITEDGIHMRPTGYAALAASGQIRTDFLRLRGG